MSTAINVRHAIYERLFTTDWTPQSAPAFVFPNEGGAETTTRPRVEITYLGGVPIKQSHDGVSVANHVVQAMVVVDEGTTEAVAAPLVQTIKERFPSGLVLASVGQITRTPNEQAPIPPEENEAPEMRVPVFIQYITWETVA